MDELKRFPTQCRYLGKNCLRYNSYDSFWIMTFDGDVTIRFTKAIFSGSEIYLEYENTIIGSFCHRGLGLDL